MVFVLSNQTISTSQANVANDAEHSPVPSAVRAGPVVKAEFTQRGLDKNRELWRSRRSFLGTSRMLRVTLAKITQAAHCAPGLSTERDGTRARVAGCERVSLGRL